MSTIPMGLTATAVGTWSMPEDTEVPVETPKDPEPEPQPE